MSEMLRAGITGSNGFVGSAVSEELQRRGYEVVKIQGDVRDRATFQNIDRLDYLFHFAAPSSQVLFKRLPIDSAEITIVGFINAMTCALRSRAKFIYPSTGTLSNGPVNEYARAKMVLEDMARNDLHDAALGIRLFAAYGPGEWHKSYYASVPYLFARQMLQGRQPMVFGDGTQTRDFIYIKDAAQAIVLAAEECSEQVIDLGSGEPISFLEIVQRINDVLVQAGEHEIRPLFLPVTNYVEHTKADPAWFKKFCPEPISFKEGIEKMVIDINSKLQS